MYLSPLVIRANRTWLGFSLPPQRDVQPLITSATLLLSRSRTIRAPVVNAAVPVPWQLVGRFGSVITRSVRGLPFRSARWTTRRVRRLPPTASIDVTTRLRPFLSFHAQASTMDPPGPRFALRNWAAASLGLSCLSPSGARPARAFAAAPALGEAVGARA